MTYQRPIVPTTYSVYFMKAEIDKWELVLLLSNMDRCPKLPPDNADVRINEKWYSVIRTEYDYRHYEGGPENIVEIFVRLQE